VWKDIIQYSPKVVRYPCTSCLLPAFNDAYCHVPATEWCQRYLPCYLFSVSNSVCFSSIYRSQAAPALRRTIGFNMQYRTSDVAQNLGRYFFSTERTSQRKVFELILTVKWKLDIPYRVSLVVNFRRCVIIAELWRPEVARPGNFVSNFCVFWKNDHSRWNVQYSVPKVFTTSPIDVVVLKCRKICPTGNWGNREVNNARFYRFPVGQILRHYNTTWPKKI